MFTSLLLTVALLPAADSRSDNDAPLFAVRFVDRNEGWAAGADGVLLHTIDGGGNWERVPLPTKGCINSIHFLTPYLGWVAGREEVQATGGSAGVLFETRDGGVTWTRLAAGALPGLHAVGFFNENIGVAVGAATDRSPSGLYRTRDGGRLWMPIPAATGGWRGAEFLDVNNVLVGGTASKLAALRRDTCLAAEIDLPPGRIVRALAAHGKTAVAVGQNGLVVVSDDGGLRYRTPDLGHRTEDFTGVNICGDHVWIVGHPGNAALHSPDRGQTWESMPTNQSVPLNAVHFLDAERGWAVGELGTVLVTHDGGKTWKTQTRGGQRAAVLCIHATPRNVPLDLIARLGGADGYLIATLCVAAPNDMDQRLIAAVRKAGGASAEVLTGFAIPAHLEAADRDELLKHWNLSHSGEAAKTLAERVAMAIRTWQPEVVICDFAGGPAESLTVDAIETAIKYVAIAESPWQVKKFYSLWDGPGAAHITVQTSDPARGLKDTPRDHALRLVGLLGDGPNLPKQRGLRLLMNNLPDGQGLGGIMDGITLAPGGTGRRTLAVEATDATEKQRREVQNLTAIAQSGAPQLGDPGAVMARVGQTLDKLPQDQAANSALALARQYAQSGNWSMAREAYHLAALRYAEQPAGLEALRWLMHYQSSSEARRRYELKQTISLQQVEFGSKIGEKESYQNNSGVRPLAEGTTTRANAILSDPVQARQWYQSAIALEPLLAKQGPLNADDPSVMMPLIAAKRQLSEVDAGKLWLRKFVNDTVGGDTPWRVAARQELWMTERGGPPPRFTAMCRKTASRPHLDGKFDDDCWQDVPTLTLKPSSDAPTDGFTTQVRFAYDNDYLYVAMECQHPEASYRPAVDKRTRDMTVEPFDRVEFLFDMDRDYATYYRFRIDQRGGLAEDCWGDASWNPHWYVASASTPTGYVAEIAIKLTDLTGDPIPTGKSWAMNAVRIVPGKGIYAAAIPAEVTPRAEGCGIMTFVDTSRR